MGTPFENFVNTELPVRPALLTLANTAYDGDPNAGGAPAVIQNAPKGTFYLQDTGGVLWQRKTPTSTSWAVIGSGVSSDTASNLGTYPTDGEGLFSSKVAGDFQFKRIKAGANVTLTPSGNYVQIDATGSGGGEANTASNLGSTVGREGLFSSKVGVDLQFKSIVPGANITLSANGTELTINSTGGVAPVVGEIIISDVSIQTTGAISNKVFVDPPTNTILQSCTSSTADIAVLVRCNYPKVIVNGVSATLPLSGGMNYVGTVNTTFAGGTLSANVDTPNGMTTTSTVTLDAPPQLLTLSFTGTYPGSQTELKAGDVIGITGTMDKLSTGIEVIDFGAGISQFVNFASNTTFTTTITVANRGTTLQALAARVRAKNAAGAWGPTRDTNQLGGTTDLVDLVNLNNLYPTVSWGAITYPGSQGALKNSETASVVITTANLNSIAFDSPNSQVSITNPTTDETPKTVTRIAGSYNIATNNLRAVATRNANAAQTTAQVVVCIANVAAGITASTANARLRSGGNDGTAVQNHTITLTSDQNLASAPTMSEQSGGGTFSGSWVGGPTVYTRTLAVSDNNTKGTYSWQSLSATNLSGLVTTTLTAGGSYVLGGFVPRSLTFAAFSQTTTLNVAVITYSKLQAGIFTATNQPATRATTQGDHANYLNQFTVDSIGTATTPLWWNDVAAASSNSSGTAQITLVEETV